MPESDNERLIRRISVRLPELERENPQRNDALLSQIARETGGKYYMGVDAIFRDKSAAGRTSCRTAPAQSFKPKRRIRNGKKPGCDG